MQCNAIYESLDSRLSHVKSRLFHVKVCTEEMSHGVAKLSGADCREKTRQHGDLVSKHLQNMPFVHTLSRNKLSSYILELLPHAVT